VGDLLRVATHLFQGKPEDRRVRFVGSGVFGGYDRIKSHRQAAQRPAEQLPVNIRNDG